MAKKTTTLGKVGAAIADAAVTAVRAADAHVVHPVGEALGLMDEKKPESKKPPAKKPATKKVAASVPAPSPKPPAKPLPKSSKQKMMGSVASKAMPKPTGKKEMPKVATKKKG